ncbi:hypothetical protein HMI54_007985, partial [Coelomomyces lativittatus]
MAEMIYHSSPSISQPAISFTRELIKLSKLLLPDSMAIHLQSIPELFFFSLQFRGNECMRQSALMAMTAIDQSLLKLKLSTTLRRSSFLTLKETLSFKRRHSNSNTTQVERASLSSKNKSQEKWNWDDIHDFLKEILNEPIKICEVLYKTHFFKKIANFFCPLQFLAFLKASSTSLNKLEDCMWLFIKCLIQIEEGVHFLLKHQLLDSIHEFFQASFLLTENQSDGSSTVSCVDFPNIKIYAHILCLLTASQFGLRLLQEFCFISSFYKLLELKNPIEIINLFLANFDYSNEGFTRLLLQKYNYSQCAWIILLLKQQLYDTDSRIFTLSLETLDEACYFNECKQILAESNLTLIHLGEASRSLLYHIASTSSGFQLFQNSEQLESELKLWFE